MGSDWMGVVHSENIPFDFGVPLLPKFLSFYSPADRNVRLLIMTMYANFARFGDPTVSCVAWDKYNSSHRSYMRVGVNPRMEASFPPRRMPFWNDYYPKLMQLKFDIIKDKVISGANAIVNVAIGKVFLVSFVVVLLMY